MKKYSILLPINKKDKLERQEGYVLGITLIVLTIALLLVASLLKRQIYHEDWTKTLQQTASTRLVAQDSLESNKDQVTRKYEKVLKETLREYKEKYSPITDSEQKAFETLATAKAYILVSQSFFHTVPSNEALYSSNLSIKEFDFRTPHVDEQTPTKVKSYNYVKFNGGFSCLSKEGLISYNSILQKVKAVEESLKKDKLNEELIDSIKSIGEEMKKKALYELVVEVKVEGNYLTTIDKEKMYLTLKLESNEDGEVPYILIIDEYVMNYKS